MFYNVWNYCGFISITKLKPLLSLVTEADPNMLVFGINDASLLFLFFASSTWLDLISVVGNPFMEFFEAASAKGLVVGLLQKIHKGGDKKALLFCLSQGSFTEVVSVPTWRVDFNWLVEAEKEMEPNGLVEGNFMVLHKVSFKQVVRRLLEKF